MLLPWVYIKSQVLVNKIRNAFTKLLELFLIFCWKTNLG